MARTHRSPDGAFAGVGAVRQSGGSLPIYVCNADGREVVWAESKRTGRKYLANVSRGYMGQRFYIAANVHDCNVYLARREQAEREEEVRADALYLISLVDCHEQGAHAEPFPRCIACEGRKPSQVIGEMINS